MANIIFIREYKAYDGKGKMYDVIYKSRTNVYYIGEGSTQFLPKTVLKYMEQAKVRICHDRWHGEEKIYEA